MKSKFTLLLLFVTHLIYSQDFTWMRGADVSGISGVYGTLGQSSPTVDPGCRHGAGVWTDANGDLWLFGGEGYSSLNSVTWLNDLWKYTVATNEWTWIGGSNLPNQPSNYGVQGVPAASNQPGAREFPVCWVDNAGKFWMLGGLGFGASSSQTSVQRMGDLWRYDPTTNQWTFMKGFVNTMQNGIYGSLQTSAAANMPGSRMASASWKDAAGDLWLFGGRGFPAVSIEGFLNDLWKYNIASNQWTWMGGTNQMGQSGTYGSLAVPSATNLPGGREFPVAWTDAQNNVYIFGGRGQGYFNDLWKFNPQTNAWTWMKGANFPNQIGTYGTVGNPAPSNVPGGRFADAHWTDAYGQFYVFGGQGWSSYPTGVNNLSDLWKYDPCTNNWTWLKGSDTLGRPGLYGPLGITTATAVPGSRFYSNVWNGKDGQLWLMGGEGYGNTVTAIDHLQDVWKYLPQAPSDVPLSIGSNMLCSGAQSTLTATAPSSVTVQWFSAATSTNVLFSGTNFVTPTLSALTNSTTFTYYAQSTCPLRPRSSITLSVYPNPTVSITGPMQVCAGAFTLNATGASQLAWSNGNNGASASFTSTGASISPTVTGTNVYGCVASDSKTITINALPSLSVAPSKTIFCALLQNPTFTISGATTYSINNVSSPAVFTYSSSTQTTLNLSILGVDQNGCVGTTTLALRFTICGGIQDNSTSSYLHLVPNPAKNKVQLNSNISNGEYELFDVKGSLVQSGIIDANNETILLDYPAGVYLLRIKSNDSFISKKLIIE